MSTNLIRTAFGKYLEGDKNYKKDVASRYTKQFPAIAQHFYPGFSFGMYGSKSTNIISYADMNANEEGYQFYMKLYEAYRKNNSFVFSVNDYKIEGFNEQKVKNTFVKGLKVNDNE